MEVTSIATTSAGGKPATESPQIRWLLIAAVAPIAWGSTYFVTHWLLPADVPLWGSVFRALPAGILLLILSRRMPRGSWWWKSLVLGLLNVSVFFVLLYVAAQLLPTTVASTIMAASPLALMLTAWLIVRERPRVLHLAGAALGIAGVALMVLTGVAAVNPLGVAASVTGMLLSSVGYMLDRRWSGQVEVLPATAWQLIAGGALLVPFAAVIEGAPPVLEAPALAGFVYVSVVATAIAYLCWFTALRRLPAGTVGLIGLLNPVTGVALGSLAAGEVLSGRQFGGMALVLAGVLLGQPIVASLLKRMPPRGRPSATIGRQDPAPRSEVPHVAPESREDLLSQHGGPR